MKLTREKREVISKCDACGVGMGNGYEASYGTTVGDYRICGSCHCELKRNGYLRIEEGKALYPNGIVKRVIEPTAEEAKWNPKQPDLCPACGRFMRLLEHRHVWECKHCEREFPDLPNE